MKTIKEMFLIMIIMAVLLPAAGVEMITEYAKRVIMKDKRATSAGQAIMKKDKGAINAGQMIGVIIALAVGIIMLSAMIPSALNTFYSANTTQWTIDGNEDTKTTTIWEMIPMMSVVAVLLLIVGIVIKMLS